MKAISAFSSSIFSQSGALKKDLGLARKFGQGCRGWAGDGGTEVIGVLRQGYRFLQVVIRYWAVVPPSITSSAPVTKEDSSEAR